MMKPNLADSFSLLLVAIRDGKFNGDCPNTFYYFGCMKSMQAVFSTVEGYDFPQEMLPSVLEMLDKAEKDGRVFWRENDNYFRQGEYDRFNNLLAAMRKVNPNIPNWGGIHSSSCDAFWNIPEMRRFLGDSVNYAFRV